MHTSIRSVASVLVLFLGMGFSSCSLFQVPDKIDATNQTTQGMSSKMDQTNSSLSLTVNGLHKQTLLVALQDMTSAEHTKVLVPVPFDMFAGGKTFAEEVHEDEVLDWFYAANKNIVEGTADESQKVLIPVLAPVSDPVSGKMMLQAQYDDVTRAGHKYKVPRTEWAFPTSYLDSFNLSKDITFNTMAVIAAFLPQEMVENLVKDQIVGHGLREQTVYLILDLRDNFVRGAFLKNSLYEDHLKNFDQYKEAFNHVSHLDYIANLGYTDAIKQVSLSGYADMSINYAYAKLANPAGLSQIREVKLPDAVAGAPAPAFAPVMIDYDMSQPLANPTGQSYFMFADDGYTVQILGQSDLRNQAIAYDPAAVKQDWKDLDRKFTQDLTPSEQAAPGAAELHAEVKSHLPH